MKKSLGVFALTMMTLSAVLNLRGIPIMASLGAWSVIYYLLGAVCFLIPSTIVCVVLSKQYPEAGGIYLWVKEGLGNSWGFLAIWMEWVNNLVSTPATLATLIGTLSFAGLSFLNNSPSHLFITLWLIYFLVTWLNASNIATSSKLNIVGALVGTLIPGLLIMGLAITAFLYHPHLASSVRTSGFLSLKPLAFSNTALFLSVLSAYSGMQITAFHFQNISNPAKTLPRALIISCVLILFLSIGTALAIFSIIPPASLQLITGVMQSFQAFFNFFGLKNLTYLLAIALAIGSLASMSAWVIGPARGFFMFAKTENLPKIFTQINKHEMPVGILKIQLLIGTLLLSVYLWMPSINQAFWFLIVITSQFTLLMFALVFIVAIKTIDSIFIKLISGLGLITVLLGFSLGLIPPALLKISHPSVYLLEIILTDCLILGIPAIWIGFSKKELLLSDPLA